MSDAASHPEKVLLEALPFAAALLDDRGLVIVANAELTRHGARAGTAVFELFGVTPGVDAARERFRDGVLRGKLDDAVVIERGPHGDDPIRVHMRSLPVGAEAFALLVVTPLPGERTLEQRVDALEARLAGIGPAKHAIGNPLMGILGYADLLRQSALETEQLRQVEAIIEQCRRVDECLTRLDELRHDGADDSNPAS